MGDNIIKFKEALEILIMIILIILGLYLFREGEYLFSVIFIILGSILTMSTRFSKIKIFSGLFSANLITDKEKQIIEESINDEQENRKSKSETSEMVEQETVESPTLDDIEKYFKEIKEEQRMEVTILFLRFTYVMRKSGELMGICELTTCEDNFSLLEKMYSEKHINSDEYTSIKIILKALSRMQESNVATLDTKEVLWLIEKGYLALNNLSEKFGVVEPKN